MVCPTFSTISFAKRNLDREGGENEQYKRFDRSNVDFSNNWWSSSVQASPPASQEERAAGNVTGTFIIWADTRRSLWSDSREAPGLDSEDLKSRVLYLIPR